MFGYKVPSFPIGPLDTVQKSASIYKGLSFTRRFLALASLAKS